MSDTNKFVAKNGIILKPFSGITSDAILKTNTQGYVVTGATFNDLSNTAHTHVTSDITNLSTFTDSRYLSLSGGTLHGSLTITSLSSVTQSIVSVTSAGTLYAQPVTDMYITDVPTILILTNTVNWNSSNVYVGPTITGVTTGQKYLNNEFSYEFISPNWFRNSSVVTDLSNQVTLGTFGNHTGDTTIHFTKNDILLDQLGDVNTAGTQQGYYLSYSANTWVGVPDSTDLTNYYNKQQVYNSAQTNANFLSANTFSSVINTNGINNTGDITATTYYGDGSHLSGLVTTNTFTTGATLNSSTITFNRNDGSGYTINLSGISNLINYYTSSQTIANFLSASTNFDSRYLSANTFATTINTNGINNTGNITATTYYGDGSNLTGIGGGTSGVSYATYNEYTGVTAPTLYLPYTIAEDTHFTTGILDNKLHSTISFNSATTEFTIAPTGTTFPVYLDGVKFEKTAQTIVLSGVSNWQPNKLFFVYFNTSACTLIASSTVWSITSTMSPVATIYWNGTTAIIGDERHGAVRNLAWHKWAHETRGTAYKSGFDATFTDTTTLITLGVLEDEDIVHNISQQTQLRVWITDVSNTATTFLDTVSDTSAHITGGALQYDNTGTSTAVQSGYFVKNYIYGTNDINFPMALIVGQHEYQNVNDARNGSFPEFPTYISAETRLLYTTIWQNVGGTATFIEKSDFRTALTAPNGILGIRPTYLAELEDVISTTPAVDDTLRFNGVNWITGPTPTSAGAGISFYYATPSLTGTTTNNTNPTSTLSKTPVTTVEQITTVTIAITGSLIMQAWLYNTALGKTTIDAGTWNFPTYAGVSSTATGRVSTITQNVYSVLPSGTTITMTGTGTARTVTANAGAPFTLTNIVDSATNTLASYLNTPLGLYQITARASNTSITISTPTGYVNETNVTFSIWKQLFSAVTPTITAISPAYALYTATSTQGSFAITTEHKIGSITFGTSNSTTSRVITMAYNGTARNSYFTTPLVITHNQLASLQGGIADQYYHLTLAELQLAQIAVPNTRTINGKTLNANITLALSDISNTAHTHSEYVSKTGDVMSGTLQLPYLTATTLSASTLYLSSRLTVSGDSYINGLTVGLGGGNISTNIAYGKEALYGNVTGGGNVMIGYRAGYVSKASNNIAIGYESMRFSTNANANANLAIGYRTLYASISGGSNIALGYYALYNSTGNSNIAIGPNAAKYANSSNELYIDNLDRTNNTNEKANAIIYGVMAASASTQSLYLNANVIINNNFSLPTTSGLSGQVLTSSGSTTYWSAIGGTGTITNGTNLGSGYGVFAQSNGDNLEFKSFVAGTGVSITTGTTEITINSTATGGITLGKVLAISSGNVLM